MYDLIVIGAGPGGYEAAAHASQMGKKVALVEEKRVGGTCLNVGCIPAKAFLRSSSLYRECGEGKPFGVEVGALSFDLPVVVERKDRIVGTLVRGVEGLLKRSGVPVFNAHARLINANQVQVGDELLNTANVLVATGSRPVVPPVPGIGSDQVLNSDSVFDLREVPSRVAIIGGGYIGLELATFFSEIGAGVVVFEMLPQIANGADVDVSERLLQSLKRAGMTFNLSCRVTGIENGTVLYEDLSAEKGTYAADCILNATGRAPVVQGVGLEEAGVDFSVKGVRISDQCRTNVSGVWACGDVTGQHMLAHVATREGIAAVNNMFGLPDQVRYDATPAVIYTHPEVASAGRTEEQLKGAGIAYKKAIVPMGVAGRFLIENERGTGFEGAGWRQVRGDPRRPRHGRLLQRVDRDRGGAHTNGAVSTSCRRGRVPPSDSFRGVTGGSTPTQVGAEEP